MMLTQVGLAKDGPDDDDEYDRVSPAGIKKHVAKFIDDVETRMSRQAALLEDIAKRMARLEADPTSEGADTGNAPVGGGAVYVAVPPAQKAEAPAKDEDGWLPSPEPPPSLFAYCVEVALGPTGPTADGVICLVHVVYMTLCQVRRRMRVGPSYNSIQLNSSQM